MMRQCRAYLHGKLSCASPFFWSRQATWQGDSAVWCDGDCLRVDALHQLGDGTDSVVHGGEGPACRRVVQLWQLVQLDSAPRLPLQYLHEF